MRTIQYGKSSSTSDRIFLIDRAQKTENKKTFGHYATHDVDIQPPARHLGREVKNVAFSLEVSCKDRESTYESVTIAEFVSSSFQALHQ